MFLSVGLRFTALFMRVSLSNFGASLDTVKAKVSTMLATLLCHVGTLEKGRLRTRFKTGRCRLFALSFRTVG